MAAAPNMEMELPAGLSALAVRSIRPYHWCMTSGFGSPGCAPATRASAAKTPGRSSFPVR